MSRALDDIAAERNRQVNVEGFSPTHDDHYDANELAVAAAIYALPNSYRNLIIDQYSSDTLLHRFWPWAMKWWKPTNRRRDLVKAGALIVAEIERIDRAEAKTKPEPWGDKITGCDDCGA